MLMNLPDTTAADNSDEDAEHVTCFDPGESGVFLAVGVSAAQTKNRRLGHLYDI